MPDLTTAIRPTKIDVDNGYDLGIAFEYTFNPKLKGSIGYLHTDTGIDAEYMLPEAPSWTPIPLAPVWPMERSPA